MRIDGVFRKYADFYGEQRDLTHRAGWPTRAGRVRPRRSSTNTNGSSATYKGLKIQIQYRFTPELQTSGGNYTLSQAQGNFNGETASDGPAPPTAQLPGVQAGELELPDRRPGHRPAAQAPGLGQLRAADPESAGRFDLGLLQRLRLRASRSSTDGTITISRLRDQPRLPDPARSRDLLLRRARRPGAGTTDAHRRRVNYAYPFRSSDAESQLFFRGVVYNLFNESGADRRRTRRS